MSKMFKISKAGKYIESEYLNYTPPNQVIDIHNWSTMLHQDRLGFEKYRDKICILEKLVQEELDLRELSHQATKIIRFHLKFIESVSDGFDIRSSWSNEKLASALVNSFDQKYNEAKARCEEHLKDLKDNPRKEYSRWREDDKYARDNDMYELGFEPLEPYYSGDPLADALKATEELLAKIKEGKLKL